MLREGDKGKLNKEFHTEALRAKNKNYINGGDVAAPIRAYNYDNPTTKRVYYFFENPSELLIPKIAQHVLLENVESKEPLLINIGMLATITLAAQTNGLGKPWLYGNVIIGLLCLLRSNNQ